jgi:hypothetical protein
MLLVLAPGLRNELPRVLGVHTLRAALSNLARAHLEGKHVLSGPADLLRRLGDADGPTVCVVDADYKWSDDEAAPSRGATAANAMKVARELARTTVSTVHAVPCREIENLLPPKLVLECFVPTDRGDFHKRCERASEVGVLGGGPRVDRLDLKKGLCRKDYEAIPKAHPQRRYLARVFEEHRDQAPTPERGWCGNEQRCNGNEKCECVLFVGLGNGLLAQVAKRLETLLAEEIAEHLLASGQPHEPAWREIGSLLFAWGCGYPRTRT